MWLRKINWPDNFVTKANVTARMYLVFDGLLHLAVFTFLPKKKNTNTLVFDRPK